MNDQYKPLVSEICEHLHDIHISHNLPMADINRFIEKINHICYWEKTMDGWLPNQSLYNFLSSVDWTGGRYAMMAQVAIIHCF